jgi:hypothetical protein
MEPLTTGKSPARGRSAGRARGLAAVALAVASVLFALVRSASGAGPTQGLAPPETGGANAFPDLNEVFQGRTFANKFERDVFFLKRIRESYPAHWSALLGANIILGDYVQAPDKLQRFVEELGAATAGTDDPSASTMLATLASDPVFYANTNAYRPMILRAAAAALIGIGPKGREALARSFSQEHYRADPGSLEVLAEVIGKSEVSDAKLAAALAATAFTFTATNGGCYPRCTQEAARNLLRLPEGTRVAGTHLNAKEALADPGRFQAVVEGISAARAVGLATNLCEIADKLASKLEALAGSPGPYREDLLELQLRVRRTLDQPRATQRKAAR